MKHTTEEARLAWLKKKAYTIRRDILLALAEAGSGHTGGSLGLTDLFTILYFHQMRYKADDPSWSERDRLILSIGHVAPVLYATLAHAGFFPTEELLTLRKKGSRLQGHPGREHGLPGLELSAGSLGQGLSVGVGMALAARLKSLHHKVVVICGDGELQEGSVWEAAMSGAHHKLDNLIAIIDRNYLQIDGKTADVMDIEPLEKKWEAFGWRVVTGDGNNLTDLMERLGEVWQSDGRPTCFIARTIMGKGLPSIENDHTWHGRAPSKQELINFLNELY